MLKYVVCDVKHVSDRYIKVQQQQLFAMIINSFKLLPILISAYTGGLYFSIARIYRKTFYREK